ncbi:MAG: virulence factor SrfC family protein [Acetobacteraceae bacterium]
MDDTALTVLAASAHSLAVAGAGAAAFALGHPTFLGQPPEPIAREFRRHARRAERLREAAESPPAVAVFGPSQSGKTYLVSRLAIARGHPLLIDFEGKRLDFLLEINPEGGQEATGLVTRFTVRRSAAPPETPVALRLLSQTDVIRILANTFLRDFQPAEIRLPTEAHLADLLGRLERQAGAAACDGLTEEDVDELGEYCERQFRQQNLIAVLRELGFWPRVRDLAPRLRATERAQLFAPLWGEIEPFTRLFDRLIRALASVGFADRAFSTLTALTPREASILNVRTLFEIDAPTTESVLVAGADGTRATLDRPVLAALVAELTLSLPAAPWPFLQRADLLDFPGARARGEIRDADAFLATPGNLGFAFLRGKVDYLFQRYNEQQDIAAMLVCVGPSTQEVQSLPGLVNGWVAQTLGDVPERRAGMRDSLFLVLTKFDLEFERKGGEDAASSARWDTRLQASLLDFLGKAYTWPTRWVPGRAFDNLFWLRSTDVAFDALFDYAGEGAGRREDRVAERAATFVAQRRNDYLASELVRRHFADPEAAWDAGLLPNDGGISRLAEALDAVCDPAMKGAQIAKQVADLARAMRDRLRPFWRSDDREVELWQAVERAQGAGRALRETIRAQMFGPLLRAMQLGAEEVRGLIWRIEGEEGLGATPMGASSLDEETERDLEELLGGPRAATSAASVQDYFDLVAARVIAAWDDSLQALAADTDRLARYRLPPDTARFLVGEVSAAARRLGLRRRLAEAERAGAAFLSRDATRSGRMALIAEDEVNGFVTWLGFHWLAADRRKVHRFIGAEKKIDAGPPIFPPRPPLRGLPPLQAQQVPYDRDFNVDWLRASIQISADNATDNGAERFDRATNDALGGLIRSIEAA